MPIMLNRMPFPKYPGEISVRAERVQVRANQMIVWVALGLKRISGPNPSAVPFPAILDTGFAHSFALQERHLIGWAGLQIKSLSAVKAVRDRGEKLLLREANVWIHANEPQQRERPTNQPPHLIAAPYGIAI